MIAKVLNTHNNMVLWSKRPRTCETKSTVAQVPVPTAKRRVMRVLVSSNPVKASARAQELRVTGVVGGLTSQSEPVAATAATNIL